LIIWKSGDDFSQFSSIKFFEMKAVNPYLNFRGNAEEVFNFYRSVFGGEFKDIVRYGDVPEVVKVVEQDRGKLMHISLPLGKNNLLMGADMLESMGQQVSYGNDFYISILTESREETERIYHGLSAAGKILTPLGDAPWGDYFARFTDKYGVKWMINFETERRRS
jgi:PhnB protein